MTEITFDQLPFIVKFASLGVFFIAWILVAEFIIDRHGLDQYLPFYRVGNLCPYEGVVIALLVFAWIWLHHK
ncbi:MAG: hypothetical protein HKN14_01435 [Marinicaulis sp.]|nr:hypothetical protein [Marinicaulis sp.]